MAPRGFRTSCGDAGGHLAERGQPLAPLQLLVGAGELGPQPLDLALQHLVALLELLGDAVVRADELVEVIHRAPASTHSPRACPPPPRACPCLPRACRTCRGLGGGRSHPRRSVKRVAPDGGGPLVGVHRGGRAGGRLQLLLHRVPAGGELGLTGVVEPDDLGEQFLHLVDEPADGGLDLRPASGGHLGGARAERVELEVERGERVDVALPPAEQRHQPAGVAAGDQVALHLRERPQLDVLVALVLQQQPQPGRLGGGRFERAGSGAAGGGGVGGHPDLGCGATPASCRLRVYRPVLGDLRKTRRFCTLAAAGRRVARPCHGRSRWPQATHRDTKNARASSDSNAPGGGEPHARAPPDGRVKPSAAPAARPRRHGRAARPAPLRGSARCANRKSRRPPRTRHRRAPAS